MLLTHFTLTETDHTPDLIDSEDAVGLRALAKAQITMAMERAQRATIDELTGRGGMPGVAPYNQDGGIPYTDLMIGEWQRDGELDCATEWCELYNAQGVHVALVVDGKPSGLPHVNDAARREVREGDWDRVVVDTFARHLALILKGTDRPWFLLDGQYCVTDWAYYGSQSGWVRFHEVGEGV